MSKTRAFYRDYWSGLDVSTLPRCPREPATLTGPVLLWGWTGRRKDSYVENDEKPLAVLLIMLQLAVV